MRNCRESFPPAGIERVSIEESRLPPQPQRSSADSIFVIERAEPALINAVEGQEGMPATAFWMSPTWLMPKAEAELGCAREKVTLLGSRPRTGLAKGSIREAGGFIGARVNYSSGNPSDHLCAGAENVGIPSWGGGLTSAVGAVGVLVASNSPRLRRVAKF